MHEDQATTAHAEAIEASSRSSETNGASAPKKHDSAKARVLSYFEEGTPTWDVVALFPAQGDWTLDDYRSLKRACGHLFPLVEYWNGRVEVLPVPTDPHQLIMLFLAGLLNQHGPSPGIALTSGLHLYLNKRKYCLPDVAYLRDPTDPRRRRGSWRGADIVMEIVSGTPKDRNRDYKRKRKAYAKAGIPEYWIVDPQEHKITVLTLDGNTYREHGVFGPGSQATSKLLPGFAVDVETALIPPRSLPEEA
jgi:Uma2 family endonuclease